MSATMTSAEARDAELRGRIGIRRRAGVSDGELSWAVETVGQEGVREVLDGEAPAFGVFLARARGAEGAELEAWATLAACDFAALGERVGSGREREVRPEWVARVRSRIHRRHRKGVDQTELVRAIIGLGVDRVQGTLESEELFGLGCARRGAAGSKGEERVWVIVGAAGARSVKSALSALDQRDGNSAAEGGNDGYSDALRGEGR